MLMKILYLANFVVLVPLFQVLVGVQCSEKDVYHCYGLHFFGFVEVFAG
jgi:hypothetical protein